MHNSIIGPGNIPSNILLVEDDMVDVMNIQRSFKKNNVQNPLFIAQNGIEALDLLRGNNGKIKINPAPSIIMLDINMPKMNGIEFLQALRSDHTLKPISVFIMTTSNDESDRLNAYNLNVAGYISKPVSYESFSNAVSVLHSFWKLCSLT
jgi:CheY-like chemotaxis protein